MAFWTIFLSTTPFPASAANGPGVPIISPNPRRYFQFKVVFQSDDLEAARMLPSLRVDFLAPPLADELVGEIFPRQVEVAKPLPFVYAVWALRRGVENQRLRRVLRETKDFGLETLDHIIHNRSDYDRDFLKDYLGWHIHYHLGADEKRGLARFMELLRKHGSGPVFEPTYVA